MDHDADLQVGANAMLVLPQAEADDGASTSPGIRGTFQAWLAPRVALAVAVSYVFINEDEVVEDAGVDLTFYTIEVGARLRSASRVARPFGELLVGRHTIAAEGPFGDDSESDLGFRLGGGLELELAGGALAVVQASYQTVEINDADLDALTLEAGISFRL